MTLQQTLPVLAPDLIARPPVMEDAPAVLDLINEQAIRMIGRPDEDLDEVISEWSSPGFDLTRDAVAAFDADGRLAAYAILYLDRPMASWFDVYLRPDRWESDTSTEHALIEWAIGRARDNMVNIPDPDMRVTIGSWAYEQDARHRAILSRYDMQVTRSSYQMMVEFDAPPQPPEPLPGIVIRPYRESDTMRAVLEALLDGWRDHRGYMERDFDERLALFEHDWKDYDLPSVWLLALEGERIVGVSLNSTNPGTDDTIGSVYTLSVRRDSRRRGIAMALLRQSFVLLYGLGKPRINLWVDAASLTGATKLYEKAGMRPIVSYVLHEKELRTGYDPTVQSLDT